MINRIRLYNIYGLNEDFSHVQGFVEIVASFRWQVECCEAETANAEASRVYLGRISCIA